MPFRRIIVLSLWLAIASAELRREVPSSLVPMVTSGPKIEAEGRVEPPARITERPALRPAILKRQADNKICGYVNGDPALSFTCIARDAICLFNSEASAVGCCLTTGCNIYTACLPYASSRALSTADLDRTRYCSEASAPYCAILSYVDEQWSGYTIPTCDITPTTYNIYHTPIPDSTFFTRPITFSSTPGPTHAGDNDDDGSNIPIGSIVGGVVGGVAVLGLIILGAIFLLRKNRSTPSTKTDASSSSPSNLNATTATSQRPFSPSPQYISSGAPHTFDPRYSMVPPVGTPSSGAHAAYPHLPHQPPSPGPAFPGQPRKQQKVYRAYFPPSGASDSGPEQHGAEEGYPQGVVELPGQGIVFEMDGTPSGAARATR